MIINNIDMRIYFLLFIIYAFTGWLIEVIGKLIQYKRFINRGFLIGPYCPIYGYGGLLITFLLKKYISDPIALFCMAILICGTLEYFTSFMMEKLFKARWWDYSGYKFNINGRICLETIIPFGLLGMFIMYISNPFLLGLLAKIPETYLNVLFYTIFIVFLTDNIVSAFIIKYIKKAEDYALTKTDNTEEITKKVKEILREKSILHRRLVKAYPKLQTIRRKIKEDRTKIKEKIEEKIESKQ